MPLFQFEAMDATGMEIKDEIEATNETEASSQIRQMGYFVTKISCKTEPRERISDAIRGGLLENAILFLRIVSVLIVPLSVGVLCSEDWHGAVLLVILSFLSWMFADHLDRG